MLGMYSSILNSKNHYKWQDYGTSVVKIELFHKVFVSLIRITFSSFRVKDVIGKLRLWITVSIALDIPLCRWYTFIPCFFFFEIFLFSLDIFWFILNYMNVSANSINYMIHQLEDIQVTLVYKVFSKFHWIITFKNYVLYYYNTI